VTDANAYWIIGRGSSALLTESLPQPQDGEVEVRALASAVSRGTEALVFHGRVPRNQHAAMRCPFQAGAFPWPVKYGYASVGVVEGGEASLRGRRVFCLHPHQDRYVVPLGAVVPVPDDVDTEVATLAANMETALNGLWDQPVAPGQRVTVIGAGLLGLFVATLAAAVPGAAVEIVDPDDARRALAAKLGLAAATDADAAAERDLVFHTSGHPDGLVLALRLAEFEATIVELSWYGDRPVALPLGEAFHSRRLRLVSSQVGHVAPAMRGRVTHRERMARALALLADPRYRRLIGERVAFADLPGAAAGIHAAASTPPAVIVTYPA